MIIWKEVFYCLHLRLEAEEPLKKLDVEENISDYQARALRALGLLLADGTPTVGGGKTF